MSFETSPDTSQASSPVTAPDSGAQTPSASVVEETQQPGQPGTSAQQPTSGSETVATHQDDLPDENAFLQMQGDERAKNWKQARARIAELNQRVATLAQLEQYKPQFERLEKFGGIEPLEQSHEVVSRLFSPVTDEQGQPVYDNYGAPQYTTQPFIDYLMQESPSTLTQMLREAAHTPLPESPQGERIGHVLMRDVLGLDPQLLEVYRQIQSPQDAHQYIARQSGIDPVEYEGINEAHHEAYRQMSESERADIQSLLFNDPQEANRRLEKERRWLENQSYITQQQQREEQQKVVQQQQWEQRVQQAAQAKVDEVRENYLTGRRNNLSETYLPFPAGSADNEIIHNEIINHAISEIERNPAIRNDLETGDRLYRLSVLYAQQGDQWRSRQAAAEADKITMKIDREFRKLETARINWWSQHFANQRAAKANELQNAQPRAEIAANGSPVAPQEPAQQRNGGFGFSQAQINEYAAQIAAQRMRG